MRKSIINTLSTLAAMLFVSTVIFAKGNYKNPQALSEKEAIARAQEDAEKLGTDIAPEREDRPLKIQIETRQKPYRGFLGTVVTPNSKQYPETTKGAAMRILDNWDELFANDAAKARKKLKSLVQDMPYEELKNIYQANHNSVI